MAYRRSYGRSAPRPARWMDLKYPGKCHVCKRTMAAGTRGFYDPATRKVTCTNIECAKADGLTRSEWFGAPTSGSWVDVLNDHRIGSGHASPEPDLFAKTRSRGYYGRDAGRCEDAPCCGCCS